MLTTQQNINRSLECVWTLSGKGLACSWVVRPAAAPAPGQKSTKNPVAQRKVA